MAPVSTKRVATPNNTDAADDAHPKVIRDAGFARRLISACDANVHCPPMHKGRLSWVQRELLRMFEQKVSIETVRKWFAGEARPRPDKMSMIAQLLEVDVAWLSLGVDPELQPRERKLRNATVDGAVNVLAGFIQMCGGHPAFPAEADERALKNHIDLYAIIKGVQYAFHVALAAHDGDGEYRFTVPTGHAESIILGVIPVSALQVKFVEITAEMVEMHGSRKGGSIELTIDAADPDLKAIETFAERL